MRQDQRLDEEVVDELLGILRDDEPSPPASLPDKTIRKVQAQITSRDLIDLTTVVFLLRFCAPLIDLIAALFGHEPGTDNRRQDNE
jgi:hypothetical protein